MKRGLGKGLGALMGESATEQTESVGVHEVDIYLLDNDTNQPRKTFDEQKLKELAQSIKIHGIMQPITVVKKEGRYTIIAGERRFRAAKMAGIDKVPILVKDLTDKEIVELSLIENIQREDLNPLEQASALNKLVQEYHLKQEEVAKRVGKSRSAIANLMRLLGLPQSVQKMVISNQISAGHARCLLPLEDEVRIKDAANIIASRDLSVRQAELLVKDMIDPKMPQKKKVHKQAVEIVQAQQELSKALATKVEIKGDLKKGKLVIEYYSEQQLEQLYEFIKSAE
ncbi:MAG: ParB/RepB/Spo0J family partition protein [Christensenellaceae bacterium]